MHCTSIENGPVIVCGLGRVGLRVADLLGKLGIEVSTVDLKHVDLGHLGIRCKKGCITGDAREEHVLEQSLVRTARALIAVTGDDMTNLCIALDARRFRPDLPVIVRLFDEQLGAELEGSLGIRGAYSTSALAAPQFAAAALGTSVLTTFEAGGLHWAVHDHEVTPSSGWVGLEVASWEETTGQSLLGVVREGRVVGPEGAPELGAGDRVIALAVVEPRAQAPRPRPALKVASLLRAIGVWWRDTPLALRATLLTLLAVVTVSVCVFASVLGIPLVDAYYFVMTTVTTTGYGDYNLMNARPWAKVYGTVVMVAGAALIAVLYGFVTDLLLRARLRDVLRLGGAPPEDHVVVAGLGSIGFRVVRELVRQGERVVAAERSETGAFVEPARALVPVVVGNARATETLRKLGLERAKAVVAATDDDLVNLGIALAARRARRDARVVLRIFDSSWADRMESSLAVDAVLSVARASAPTLVGAALDRDVVRGLALPNALLLILHRAVDEPRAWPSVERPVLWRSTPTGRFSRLTAETGLKAGDQVISVQWRRFEEG